MVPTIEKPEVQIAPEGAGNLWKVVRRQVK
jgi:hypothetical protein